MKKITLVDVAEKANVSISAVSRFINNSGYVSEEKQKSIKDAIEELGYLPQMQKSKPSNLICLISLNSSHNIYYHMVWSNLVKEAQKKGKSLMVVTDTWVTNNNLQQLVKKALEHDVEGIVFSSYLDDDMSEENNKYLQNLPIPVVMFDRTGNSHDLNKVTFDEGSAIEIAVKYLARLGHKRIAYIGLVPNYDVETDRYEGYMRAVRKNDLVYDEKLVSLKSGYTEDLGRFAMQQLLSDNEGITAVVTGSDILAVGALQALNENGLKVPQDISIIGHDDAYAQFCFPRLTSIQYPMAEAAEAAVNIIMNQHGKTNNEISLVSTKLGLTLTHRDSVRKL